MAIEPRGRSPLGAFYRTPLAVFGPGIQVAGTVSTADAFIARFRHDFCNPPIQEAAAPNSYGSVFNINAGFSGVTPSTINSVTYTGATSGASFNASLVSWDVDRCAAALNAAYESVARDGIWPDTLIRGVQFSAGSAWQINLFVQNGQSPVGFVAGEQLLIS